jgi:hypothetical protein
MPCPSTCDSGDFRSTLSGVKIHASARKHGVADEDILHAIDHALVIEDIGEDPDRWLVLGPDRAANVLEVVVLTTVEGTQLAIHAMSMRPTYERLLRP